MQEASGVDLLQPVEQRPQDPFDRLRAHRSVLAQMTFERVAAQHLHDDVGRAVDLEKVEDLHDAGRLVQRRQGTAFGDEALAPPGEVVGDLGRARLYRRAGVAVGQQGRQIFFDGHFAAKLHVARPVGDAEAALAQYRDDFISPDLRLGRECRDVDVARACGRAGIHFNRASAGPAVHDRDGANSAWRRNKRHFDCRPPPQSNRRPFSASGQDVQAESASKYPRLDYDQDATSRRMSQIRSRPFQLGHDAVALCRRLAVLRHVVPIFRKRYVNEVPGVGFRLLVAHVIGPAADRGKRMPDPRRRPTSADASGESRCWATCAIMEWTLLPPRQSLTSRARCQHQGRDNQRLPRYHLLPLHLSTIGSKHKATARGRHYG